MCRKHLLILSLFSLLVISCNEKSSSEATVSNTPIPTSNSQSPTQAIPAVSANVNLSKSGKFVSGEHTTTGKVTLITKDGKSSLVFDPSFKTSESGPDLVVVLHRSNNVIGSTRPPAHPLEKGDYLFLSPLKKYSGSQTYSIPSNIKLEDYKSVAIWCRKFNATFGAASLI
ncbi:DM13 domain-containing protein [Cronbergia sp. UHCC 0137]|uniref:DM13 domain-containing protein n=1 Tax=Cronbergia sp. UHCC 0137 TaxID=3110239 RepID=UPI002B21EAF7|nr:DM13 domain-containing protein [Cronbergia sp. UHCC 0137]MEA5617241.1 DM13 domain-containing protein [Cronbergia sp. UHCC 0137]